MERQRAGRWLWANRCGLVLMLGNRITTAWSSMPMGKRLLSRRVANDEAALLELINGVYTPVERMTGQIPTHEIDELLLLSSWFRRFPTELERTSAARGLVPLAAAS